MKYIFTCAFILLSILSQAQTNSFPLYSYGAYSGVSSGDNTNISNAQLKLQSSTGYIRIPHVSNHSSVSTVYNYETGKSIYWGESSDVGQYLFRGRDFIVEEGKLGIGTTSPSFKLNVLGTTGDSNTGVLGIDGSGANASLRLGINTNYSWIQAHGSKPLYINELGNNIILNLNGGNVGIGTTSPTSKLDIDIGNSNTLSLSLKSTSSSSHWSGGLSFSSAFTSAPFYIYSFDNELQFSQRNADGSYKSHFMVFNNASGNVIFPNSIGNVGIGTTSPDAKLAVSGQVHAQEVKVSIAVPGPDYVFEKDYKLSSLEEIKNYIDQNKHLPEVPSAKEMAKNGIQLGEMNMLLLRKIEELTLYVIEQNKQIAQLKERSVSPDASGKKIEELTLYTIELNRQMVQLRNENRNQQNEIETLKSKK